MRKHFTNFILMFILFVGLSLLLYPTASDYWNSHHQTRAITTYADNVAALDHARYEELLEAARQYNEKLASQEPHYRLSEEEKEQAKADMGKMLDYIDKLNELDTSGVEPMSHVFPVENVMREDVVTNGDGSEATLANAPERKEDAFVVPKTVD